MGRHSNKTGDTGAALVVALTGGDKVLLIRELTKPSPVFHKFISETFKNGEKVLDVLVRAVREEANFPLPHERDQSGHVTKIVNFTTTMSACETINTYNRTHHRHFVIVKMPESILVAQGGKKFITSDNERIETSIHELDGLRTVPNFLPQQEELRKKLFEFLRESTP